MSMRNNIGKIGCHLRKYRDSVTLYALSAMYVVGGAAISIDSKDYPSQLVIGLFVSAIGLCVSLMGKAEKEIADSKYKAFQEHIEEFGLTQPLIINCEYSPDIDEIVRNITEAKGIMEEYRKAKKKYRIKVIG